MGRRRSKKKLKILVNPKGDRISSLPDDLIHRILSLIDAKDAVQTSLLSTRWKNVWESSSRLNFNCSYFTRLTDFRKFLSRFLLYRDHQSDLSVFNLSCRGLIQQFLIRRIATYGASHNLQDLNISSCFHELPPSVFTSQSLKQLRLKTRWTCKLSKSAWNLPTLTTLSLQRFSFTSCSSDGGTSKSLDLFSNLPNLKNLSLIGLGIENLEVFYITAPQLVNLDIKIDYYLVIRCEFVISAPKLCSFKYAGDKPLLLSANDLNCLDEVHIDFRYWHLKDERGHGMCKEIISMFYQLRVAKFLTLSLRTIEVLSGVLELLENQPSPFCKLECLKIENGYRRKDSILSTGALTFLCNSSPTSNIINESSLLFQDP